MSYYEANNKRLTRGNSDHISGRYERNLEGKDSNSDTSRHYLRLINEQFRSLQLDQSLRLKSIFDLIDYCESMYEKLSQLGNSQEGLQCYIKGYLVFNYSINSFIMLHFGGFDKFIESSEHDFIIYLNVFAFYNTDEIIKSDSYAVSTIILRKWMLDYLVERDLLSFDVKELYDWLYQYIAYLKEKDKIAGDDSSQIEPYSANDFEFIENHVDRKEAMSNELIPKSRTNHDLSQEIWNKRNLHDDSDEESFMLSPDTELVGRFRDRFPSISLKQDRRSIHLEDSADDYILPTNSSLNNDFNRAPAFMQPPSKSPPPPPPPEHSSNVTPYPIEKASLTKSNETPYPVEIVPVKEIAPVISDPNLLGRISNNELSRKEARYSRPPETLPFPPIKSSRYEPPVATPIANGTFSRASTVPLNAIPTIPNNTIGNGNAFQVPPPNYPPQQYPYNVSRSSQKAIQQLGIPPPLPPPLPPTRLDSSTIPLQSNKSLNAYSSKSIEERKIEYVRRNTNKTAYMKQLGVCGLRNFGSTCYINLTIQLMFGLSYFKSVFANGEFLQFIRNPKFIALYNQLRATKDSLLLSEAISGLLKVFEDHGGASIAPTKFLRITSLLKKDFNIPYEQQDAQEFLLFLLDRLHDELSSKNSPETILGTLEDYVLKWNINISMKDKDEYLKWYESLIKQEGTSPIHDLFQGHIQNKLTCYKCNHESISYSPFTILSLPIPTTNSTTVNLADCLKYYTQDEVLSGENAWHCPKCSSKEDNGHALDNHPVFSSKKSGLLKFSKRSKSPAKEKPKNTPAKTESLSLKKLTYIKLPQIMMIHLSRFSMYNLEHKLNTNIQYPLQLTFNNNDHQIIYKLAGIINHYGNLKSGHYTSMVNKAYSQPYVDPMDTLNNPYWCLFDDENVKVDLSNGDSMDPRHRELHSKDVYVLCYERI